MNTNGDAATRGNHQFTSELRELLDRLRDKDELLNVNSPVRLQTLAKSPGKDIQGLWTQQVLATKNMAELEVIFTDFPHRRVAKIMLEKLRRN